jgi:hypothetical protein
MWLSYYCLVPFNVCDRQNIVHEVRALPNFSEYVYCTSRNKGIKQMCPPDTEVSYDSDSPSRQIRLSNPVGSYRKNYRI